MSFGEEKEDRLNSGEDSRVSTSSNFTGPGVNSASDIENDSTGSSFPLLSEGEEVVPNSKKVTKRYASNLSLSCQRFMFDSDMNAAQISRRKKDRKNRNISFSPLSQYIEMVTFDSTCREAEEVLNIYVRTQFPTAQIFDRAMKVNYHRLEDIDEAARYWDSVLPQDEPFLVEPIYTKPEIEADFEYRVNFIEENWNHGLPFEDDAEECTEHMLFPEANREIIEEQNYELIETILSVLPLDRHHINLNVQKMCEVFTNYVSLGYLVGMLNRGSFKAKMTYVLSHPTLEVENNDYDWELGKQGLERILALFETEQDTFDAVSDGELLKIGQLNEAVLGTLNCRILTKVEGEDDDDTESFFGLNQAFRMKTTEETTETFFDLISKQYLKIARRSIDNNDFYDEDNEEESDQESSSELFFEVTSQKFITNPSPIVVPQSWHELDLISFLLNPWNAWNTAKIIFLGSYFELLNQMMVSACLNNNITLLNMVRTRPLPNAFKTRLIAHCSFAENSKLGTVQLAVFNPNDKLKTRKSKRRYLAVNSNSFFLNPLVRADLYFSYTQHCLLNQPCKGHKGLLLLYMLRMGRREIAEVLMEEGVNVNFKVCSLPARSITYKAELDNPISGLISQKQKKDREMAPKNTEAKALLKSYVRATGILENNFVRLVAKSTRYTPLAAAVAEALDSGNNETVNALFAERGARVVRADFCAFRALLPFLREVSNSFLNRKVEKKKKSKRFSLLPRRKSKIDTNSTESGLCFLNTHIPQTVVDELAADKNNAPKIELVLLLIRAARAESSKMQEDSQTKYLKSVLIHMALIYEEWNVVRFLIQDNFDDINRKAIEYVFDIFLFDLIRGDYPFAGRALNGIYFLLQEFDLFPTFEQVQRLMLIFAEGLLNLPYLPGATGQPIKLIFASRQIQYFFDFFGKYKGQPVSKNNFIFIQSFDDDTYLANVKQIEAIRFELCLGLYKKNFIDSANSLITPDLEKNSTFLNDLLTVTALDNTCVDALPAVYKLVIAHRNIVQRSLEYVVLASIHSNGLSMEFIRCGALSRDNICDFFYTLMVQFEGRIPELFSHEIVADFSYVFVLMAVVEFMKTAEVDNTREDIYKALFERLCKTDRFWMEGMQYVFDFGKIKQESDVKSDLEALVEQEAQYVISYDPLRSLVSLSKITRTTIPRRIHNPLRLASHEYDITSVSDLL